MISRRNCHAGEVLDQCTLPKPTNQWRPILLYMVKWGSLLFSLVSVNTKPLDQYYGNSACKKDLLEKITSLQLVVVNPILLVYGRHRNHENSRFVQRKVKEFSVSSLTPHGAMELRYFHVTGPSSTVVQSQRQL